jgi:tetratricopeptide (TPR) repeat protein
MLPVTTSTAGALHAVLRRLSVFVLVLAGAVSACGHKQQRNNEKANRFQAEGARAYARGELDRAAGLFSLALEYEPRMAEARNGLGLVALARGDKATAEAQFKAALSYNEELAEAHYHLGILALDRNELEDATTRFRQALAIDPGFGPARLQIGQVLLRQGKLDEARWELVKLTEVEPRNAAAHASYSRVLTRLGRVAAAEAAAQKALALDSKLASAHAARGEILLSRGEFAGCADEFRIASQIEPMVVDDRVVLTRCLISAARLDEAETELNSLEKLAPTMPQAALLRAVLAQKRGECPIAIEAAQRALRLKRPFPEVRVPLAECLYMLGRTGEGRDELKRFLDEAPPSMELERRKAIEFLNR